jgi:hypothetical protein
MRGIPSMLKDDWIRGFPGQLASEYFNLRPRFAIEYSGQTVAISVGPYALPAGTSFWSGALAGIYTVGGDLSLARHWLFRSFRMIARAIAANLFLGINQALGDFPRPIGMAFCRTRPPSSITSGKGRTQEADTALAVS